MFVQAEVSPNANTLTKTRILNANSTARAVSAVPGNLYKVSITNGHSAVIYVKFYDIAAATVNPASDVPVENIAVPATSTFVLAGFDVPESFSTACSVRCVTDFGDTGTTAPATLPIITTRYCGVKTGN